MDPSKKTDTGINLLSTDLSTYNNSWYKPGTAIKRVGWFITQIVFFRNAFLPFYGFKVFLLRLFGAKIGKGVVIKPGVRVKYPWFLEVGDFSWIGENVWIDNLTKVSLGSHVCLSQGALLLCGNHDFKSVSFDLDVRPIILENGVWIGAQGIVVGGVTGYSHAVLTAGSVATKDLEAYSIYQGNPALKIRNREIIHN